MTKLLAWTHPRDYGGFSPDGDYCILTQNRDSSSLDRSNWICIAKHLGAQAYDDGADGFANRPTVYHWRAGHWACGWVEYMMIRADAPAAIIAKAEAAHDKLDDYPVFNEDHWSELEYNEVLDYWNRSSLSMRVDMCRDAGESIFAARHDSPPESVYETLRD